MKNDEKKWHSKNDKVIDVLLYHFLNDENHTQIESPGKKKAASVYSKEKKLELTFTNFLTIKKLELDLTNLFNHGKNNQHWIVYWRLERKKVLIECQLCNF